VDLLRASGFQVDLIYPADCPSSALLSRDGHQLWLKRPGAEPAPLEPAPFVPEFVVNRAGGSAAVGRAGMLYRDLIPGRLGGRYIASHITIPDGGPVADWVHYHAVLLQLIYVRRGWVSVVYEHQGDPFRMNEGDMVLQPPFIRHRVLETAPGTEVVEISAPALHETFGDHELELPNGKVLDRRWGDQRFLWHRAELVPWIAWNGAVAQESSVLAASGGIVELRTVRPGASPAIAVPAHHGELVFGFVLEGCACVHGADLCSSDAFVIPPGESWSITRMSSDFRLLHVTSSTLDAAPSCLL
jgi:quercetin dioxygenase-like cupin family protein